MVTDFSVEDKASGIKFCVVVQWHPRQRISHFGELCSPRRSVAHALADSPCMLAMHRIGMCGYTTVPEDGRTCYVPMPLMQKHIYWEVKQVY